MARWPDGNRDHPVDRDRSAKPDPHRIATQDAAKMLTRAQIQEAVTRKCGAIKVDIDLLRGDEAAIRGFDVWRLSTDALIPVGAVYEFHRMGITFRSNAPLSEAERCASELAEGVRNPAKVPVASWDESTVQRSG